MPRDSLSKLTFLSFSVTVFVLFLSMTTHRQSLPDDSHDMASVTTDCHQRSQHVLTSEEAKEHSGWQLSLGPLGAVLHMHGCVYHLLPSLKPDSNENVRPPTMVTRARLQFIPGTRSVEMKADLE